ncbi:MAG: hypothetical protein JJU16_04775 [Alkalibacterium sp.]|nr:hypothetical protein [Alkalibacterium sp.]
MTSKQTVLINPFHFIVDPMERLLLINFQKDPDEHYMGFEPQVFDDAVNGIGHLVIGWRRDGKIDVYHQSSLNLSEKLFDITGREPADILECSFEVASFEIDQRGVQALYRFTDKYNRPVKIKINEKNYKKRYPFNMLAPLGHSVDTPSSLPLIYLFDFYFVRKSHTVIDIQISGKNHKLDTLAVPIDGMKMYFTRYSSKPLIAEFNPALDDHISLLKVTDEQDSVKTKTGIIELNWANSVPSIKTLRQTNAVFPIELTFIPPFPDITALENNKMREGIMQISCHASLGLIIGRYQVVRRGKNIKIKCSPSKGWSPVPEKWSLRFLYKTTPVFREWTKSYEWTAYIYERNQSNYYMHSRWKRLNR